VPVTLAELEQRLTEHKGKHPEFPIVVRGDRATQYQGNMDVLDVIGRVGITKIGLATQAPK
jgi:biopolymer transport protein ExbD